MLGGPTLNRQGAWDLSDGEGTVDYDTMTRSKVVSLPDDVAAEARALSRMEGASTRSEAVPDRSRGAATQEPHVQGALGQEIRG